MCLQYVPAAQEAVIGVITQKIGEGYRVDIGSAHYASLDGLAFEGATKRNKPNLKVRNNLLYRGLWAERNVDGGCRWGVLCMLVSHWPIKTWSLSLNASMHKHGRLKGLAK